MSQPEPTPALSYGHEPAPHATRVWAAGVLVFAALGLAVVGGCFLIGIMLLSTNGFSNAPLQWMPRHYLLIGVLYLLAFLSFASAAILFFRTVRGLIRLLMQT